MSPKQHDCEEPTGQQKADRSESLIITHNATLELLYASLLFHQLLTETD